MKNYAVLPVILVITGLWIVSATHAFSAEELWYPGGIGSSWAYQSDVGYVITVVADNPITLNDITYRTVKESSMLIGAWGDENIIDPFLTFRADGRNRIVGYGNDMNEKIKNNVIDALIRVGYRRGSDMGIFSEQRMGFTGWQRSAKWHVDCHANQNDSRYGGLGLGGYS